MSSKSRSACHITILLALGATLVMSGHLASAKVEFDSNQLLMKNSEEFTSLVKRKIKLASNIQSRQKLDLESGLVAEPEAVAYLTDALRIVLSRTDQDATVDDLFNTVRHELQDLNSFDDAAKSLAIESIQALKDDGTAVRIQGTYVAILNNLVSEIKPDLRIGSELFKTTEMIRDAHLKISDKLKSQTFMRSMATPGSPSDAAKRALAGAKPETKISTDAKRKSSPDSKGKKSSKRPSKDEDPDRDNDGD